MKIWRDSRVWTAASAFALAACIGGADARSARDSAATNQQVELDEAPARATRFIVASVGNAARYRVREQLMGRDLPNDAVGETEQITGAITVSETGTLIPGQSRFVVRTTALKSDSDRRDGYVRRRLLESEQYPTVELVPTVVRGLPTRLPPAGSTGSITFELIGDLTVRGVTRPTTWRVTAHESSGQLTGTASTTFNFAQFGITPPRVPIVLSVADTIALEYDFTLSRASSGSE